MNDVHIVAETQRLRLRRFVDSDAGFYRQMLNDPDFIHFIVDRHIDSDAAALVDMQTRVYASYQKHGFGMYRVDMAETGQPVGMAGLVRRDFLDGPDLGYALLPAGRGQGLATEAGAALLQHARDDLRLARLAAVTVQENTASIRVLQRLGFLDAGTLVWPDSGETCALFDCDLSTVVG
jgi:ribosomal-protein-alanine N-acetyltransferase